MKKFMRETTIVRLWIKWSAGYLIWVRMILPGKSLRPTSMVEKEHMAGPMSGEAKALARTSDSFREYPISEPRRKTRMASVPY